MPDPAPAEPPATAPPPAQRGPGWHVDPAPDGRGKPPDGKAPMLPWARRWLPFFIALLVLNLVLSFATSRPVSHTQVPYQPFFLGQLGAGNVQDISSRADSLEGDLRSPRATTRRVTPARLR